MKTKCPHCGYCDKCGRSDVQPYPYRPGPYWVYPPPYWQYPQYPRWGTTGGIQVGSGWNTTSSQNVQISSPSI